MPRRSSLARGALVFGDSPAWAAAFLEINLARMRFAVGAFCWLIAGICL